MTRRTHDDARNSSSPHPDRADACPGLGIVYTDELERVGEWEPLAPGVYPLGRVSEVLGREIIEDPQMSREHAELIVQPNKSEGGWPKITLRDCGSLNGTFVEGATLNGTTVLEPGTIFQVGTTFLTIDWLPDPSLEGVRASMIGASAEALGVRAALASRDQERGPITLVGEAGVGKRATALRWHQRIEPSTPFQVVDADAAEPGPSERIDALLRAAEGGSLFIRGVERLSDSAQEILAGWTKSGSRVRLICSSRVPLDVAAREGRLRADLAETLREDALFIAPLRERRMDIGVLVARRLLDRPGALFPIVETQLMWRLLDHPWADNARELQSVVDGACKEAADGELGVTPKLRRALGESVRRHPVSGADRATIGSGIPAMGTDAPASREELIGVLTEHRAVISRVAAHYGKHRQQVYRWLKHFDVELDDFRG